MSRDIFQYNKLYKNHLIVEIDIGKAAFLS